MAENKDSKREASDAVEREKAESRRSRGKWARGCFRGGIWKSQLGAASKSERGAHRKPHSGVEKVGFGGRGDLWEITMEGSDFFINSVKSQKKTDRRCAHLLNCPVRGIGFTEQGLGGEQRKSPRTYVKK